MAVYVPDYFDKFRCIGGKCQHNCCIGWEIDIDDKSYEKYVNTEGNFGDRLRKSMKADGEKSFILSGIRCPFLNSENLCDIFCELGEDALCTVCTEYPRFTEQFGDISERGLSISCEEVGRILFSQKEPVKFIKADIKIENNNDDSDISLFEPLKIARKKIFAILQNRNLSINERVLKMLEYSRLLQDEINTGKTITSEDIKNIEIPDTAYKYSDSKFTAMQACLELLKEIEILDDDWLCIVDKTLNILHNNINADTYKDIHSEFECYYSQNEYVYEQLLVYFIFRYFLKAVYDNDVFSKVRFAVLGYLVIKEFDVCVWLENNKSFTFPDRIENARIFSEEIEHCEDNVEFLYEEFIFNEIFEYERFKAMI